MKASELKITTLCENSTVRANLLGEWGLSLLVETGKFKIIFDTGAGKTLISNADAMGVELSNINFVLFSHGHQDHTGGIKPLLEKIKPINPGKKIKIFAHDKTFNPKYIKDKNERFNYRGFPYIIEELESLGAEFNTSTESSMISEDIIISGEIPRENNYEIIAGDLFCKDKDNNYIPDPFSDEKVLYIKTEEGLVVISGCAHRGIINTIKHGLNLTGLEETFLVIGGTHLADVSEEQFNQTVKELKSLEVKNLGVSHCTGLQQSARLYELLGEDIFFYNNAGTVLKLRSRN